MNVIDCRLISKNIRKSIKDQVVKMAIKPGLAMISVGINQASQLYMRNRIKAANDVGISAVAMPFIDSVTTEYLVHIVEHLAQSSDIHGIIIDLPLPKHIDQDKLFSAIPPIKDVDCLTHENLGRLFAGNPTYEPCTPSGVIKILDSVSFDYAGKDAVVIGRSNIVGKPMSAMLLKKDMSVSICHSWTSDLATYTKKADLIVCATGYHGVLTADMVSQKAVVIDCGIAVCDGKVTGDVDFDSVAPVVKAITPVPGGSGLLTVPMLLQNTIKAVLLQNI